MRETSIPITRSLSLIAHPERFTPTGRLSYDQALSLLRQARSNMSVMNDFRRILARHDVSRLTDDQVLDEVAHAVTRRAMGLQVEAAKNDLSPRFMFRAWREGPYSYKQASGELGVPGKVITHRNEYAQRKLSGKSGDHAGHLIGTQFGAPGDERNLGLQNANMNTFAPKEVQVMLQGRGGSYHDLESEWARLLKMGYRIFVTVVDKYRQDKYNDRPFVRSVQWTEIDPDGIRSAQKSLDFGNFSSPQSRMAGAAPSP